MKSNGIRIYAADAIRVIGAFAVVCIHVTDELVVLPNHYGGLSWWLANIINAFSRIAVPLFIMLSGYLLLDRNKNVETKPFLKKRLVYAGVPLLIWTLLYFLWYWFFYKHPFTWFDIGHSLWTVTVFHLHFLIIILGLYLLTPFLKKYTDKITNKKLLLTTVIWAFITVLIGLGMYMFPGLRGLKNLIVVPVLFGSYYLYGQYIRRIVISKLLTWIFTLLFIGLGCLTAWLVYHDIKSPLFHAKGFGEYFQDPLSINILLMSFLIFPVLTQLKPRLVRTIRYIAATTYGIYIIHPMIIDMVNRFLPLNIHQMSRAIWLFVGLKIILIFALSFTVVAVWRFCIEKLRAEKQTTSK